MRNFHPANTGIGFLLTRGVNTLSPSVNGAGLLTHVLANASEMPSIIYLIPVVFIEFATDASDKSSFASSNQDG